MGLVPQTLLRLLPVAVLVFLALCFPTTSPQDYEDVHFDADSPFESLDITTPEQYRRLDDWLCQHARFCPSACTPCYDDPRCQLYGDCCHRYGVSRT